MMMGSDLVGRVLNCAYRSTDFGLEGSKFILVRRAAASMWSAAFDNFSGSAGDGSEKLQCAAHCTHIEVAFHSCSFPYQLVTGRYRIDLFTWSILDGQAFGDRCHPCLFVCQKSPL